MKRYGEVFALLIFAGVWVCCSWVFIKGQQGLNGIIGNEILMIRTFTEDDLIAGIVHVDLRPKYIFPIHEDDFIWDGKNGDITSAYGERDPNEIGGLGDWFHNGFDSWGISNVGTWQARTVSVAAGVILHHWLNHPVKGKSIEILHDDGSISEYSHLSKSYIHEKRLKDGSLIPWRVKQGDVIGRIGNTGLSKGRLTYKTHLHFSLRIPDENDVLEYVNPLKYIPVPLP